MNILSNTTAGIYPIREDGFKLGEMMVIGGCQSGKSLYYSYNQNLCKEIVLDGQINMTEMTFNFKYGNESKYKFSRAKWHVAEFDDRDYIAVDEWCEKQFGPHPKRPDAWSRWVHKYVNQIHFREEKDYVLFMLRWS